MRTSSLRIQISHLSGRSYQMFSLYYVIRLLDHSGTRSLSSLNSYIYHWDLTALAMCTMRAHISLFKYWLFASAFFTIYIILDAVLDSYTGFRNFYESWADCMVFSGSSQDFAPTVRAIVVGIFALIFLRMQTVGSSALLSMIFRPKWYALHLTSSI